MEQNVGSINTTFEASLIIWDVRLQLITYTFSFFGM
jgi:hypothetical protein